MEKIIDLNEYRKAGYDSVLIKDGWYEQRIDLKRG